MILKFVVLLILVVVSILLSVFFLVSKNEKWEMLESSSFECGFSSYFYSRFSFSIHYFQVGLIFLFLDLELCFLMPFFMDFFWIYHFNYLILFIVSILLLGLVQELKEGEINWIY